MKMHLLLASVLALAWCPIGRATVVKIDGRTFTLPDGFTIEKVASSPLVDRPITIDFDEQGRLYGADSSGSSDRVQKQLEEKPHRIVRLEDSDGDGVYDKQVVFADKMMFPEGTLWHDGSLYVSAPPSIWKLTDTDNDGIADQRIEWHQGKTLTGCANDLHGPYLGPDGWIYWAKGAFAEQTYPRPGKSPLVTKASHIFRARAGGESAGNIESVMAGGMDNPVDVVFTAAGERLFTTTFLQNPAGGKRDGIIHAIYGGVYGKVHNVIDNHPRTHPDVMPPLVHLGPAAPAGLHRYESDALGREYQNSLFAALFNLHKVTRHALTPSGGTFTSKDEDFLVCDSLDFHPTDVIEDGDGSLLVIDTGGWYKLCCPTSQLGKPDILGAIYRVRRTDVPRVEDPRGRSILWETFNAQGLSQLIDDARPFVRKRAMRMLATHENDAIAPLVTRAADGKSALARLNVVWTATRMDVPAARNLARAALQDADETVRHAAVHSVALHRDHAAIAVLLTLLQKDGPQVQRAAAEALGRIGHASAIPGLLGAIEKSDPADRILEHSLIFALIEIGETPDTVSALTSPNPRLRRAAIVALDQMGADHLKAEVIAAELTSEDAALRETAAWIAGRHPEWGGALTDAVARLMASPPGSPEERKRFTQQAARLAKTSPALQALLANHIVDGDTPQQLLSLEIVRDAAPWSLPQSIFDSIQVVLEGGSPKAMPSAVATVRALALPKERAGGFARPLLMVVVNEMLPIAVRLEAAAAIPRVAISVSDDVVAFLTSQAVSELPLQQRLNAAEGLNRLRLSSQQLRSLSTVIVSAGPMELDRILAAAEQSKEIEVGRELIAALKEARNIKALAPEIIRRRFMKYPEPIQQDAEALITAISPDTAKQKARLDELLAKLPAGDVRRGQIIFNSDKAACATCHAIGYLGGNVGPDLTKIGSIRQERDLLESMVFPSASFTQTYEPVQVDTRDNDRQYGLLRKNDSDEVVLLTGPNAEVRIPRANVKIMKPGTVSVMPEGFDQNFNPQDLADILAFLKACR